METTITQPQQETVFFQDANVTVTQSRFISGGQTFAMRNISSVSNFHIKKSRAGAILLLMLGILMLFSEATRGMGIALALAGGVWLYFTKDSYAVRINSNSAEANGFVAKDRDYIQKILDAVNEAMVFRG
ncbi:DUF6232 family protein [Rufibacter sp. LB8]|uniref:DUF6232 family protein n=1 Tax=Rufibacter sp. LB8 TaxID=2777781 RepID=UPI00178C74D1|nr:DUF6232 family protein [Rufibacter sp. LB8]